MSDRRTTRHERDGTSSDEHLRDRDKQQERQTETDDARNAVARPGEGRHGQVAGGGDEPRDRVDEMSEESFPASDPPQQP